MAERPTHPPPPTPTAPRSSGAAGGHSSASLFAWAVGLGLALLITLAGVLGAFEPAEGWLLDRRAHWAAGMAPEPSYAIVHVDIDEAALEKIDRWPWNRVELARAVEAMDYLGARTILLDLLITHPQRETIEEVGGRYVHVPNDEELARAMRDAGNVIVAAAIESRNDDAGGTTERIRWPIPPVLEAAAGTGFVNAGLGETDTIVRRLPAYADVDGERLWQLGVRATAHYLGRGEDGLGATPDRLTIGERRVALRDGRFVVPWRPRTDDEVAARKAEAAGGGRAYVIVDGKESPWQLVHSRVSIAELVQLGRARAEFFDQRREAMRLINGAAPEGEVTPAMIRETDANREFFLRGFPDGPVAALEATSDPRERATLRALIAWPALRTLEANLHERGMTGFEEALRERMDDKLVIVGWTAEGAIADFYPTALGRRTPGAMVHSAAANGLLTGHWFHDAAWWLDGVFTLGLGLLGVLAGTLIRPGLGWIAAAGVICAYAAVNVWWYYGVSDTVLALGGPVFACSGSWLGVRLVRAADDLREKARVTRMFRSRVSSNLVDFLTEHPERMNMEGEERELTMCFTDLAGFTALSERLGGARTVRVLNRCLGDLTREMLERRAYINKFLGDGIMAFWGAPIPDEQQADHAVLSVVACYEALARINAEHAREGLPPLGMRAGVATGEVIVGDCGAPPDLNDYTVIGDSVNLAARLESANKLLGIEAMVNGRTYERLSDEVREGVLWRHLARLRVVGQSADVPIHEIVVPRPGEDVEELRAWIARTHEAVDAFCSGDIERARAMWDALSREERGGAGAALYREECDAILAGDHEACGALVLRSK